ncbi:geminin-like [Lineus longissimus]|uniref:geminin-like n=1 Tax=Lineus longissimus TaxID=88925 RepID=UPI00315D7856
MSENSIRVSTLNTANLGNGKKPSRSGKIKKRPGLKTLQPSAHNTKQVVGNRRENFFTPKKSQKRKLDDENQSEGTPTKVAKVIKPRPASELKIFHDPEPENETIDKEAYELMVQETVPESYWEEVAEQRRVALADALDENEKVGEAKISKLLYQSFDGITNFNTKCRIFDAKSPSLQYLIQT